MPKLPNLFRGRPGARDRHFMNTKTSYRNNYETQMNISIAY